MKLKHLKYKERLERLKLPTYYDTELGDMIEVYKILTESFRVRLLQKRELRTRTPKEECH